MSEETGNAYINGSLVSDRGGMVVTRRTKLNSRRGGHSTSNNTTTAIPTMAAAPTQESHAK